jgi:hypothetical protein
MLHVLQVHSHSLARTHTHSHTTRMHTHAHNTPHTTHKHAHILTKQSPNICPAVRPDKPSVRHKVHQRWLLLRLSAAFLSFSASLILSHKVQTYKTLSRALYCLYSRYHLFSDWLIDMFGKFKQDSDRTF